MSLSHLSDLARWLAVVLTWPCSIPSFLPPFLPPCLPASLLPASLPACLPVCLSVCLSVSLSPSVPACLSPFLPACLPASLPACLSPSLPSSLSPCPPSTLPCPPRDSSWGDYQLITFTLPGTIRVPQSPSYIHTRPSLIPAKVTIFIQPSPNPGIALISPPPTKSPSSSHLRSTPKPFPYLSPNIFPIPLPHPTSDSPPKPFPYLSPNIFPNISPSPGIVLISALPKSPSSSHLNTIICQAHTKTFIPGCCPLTP
ncbi:hypothetical protein Pcinc_037356 [Petrolisthes cinctipes]|uniref:Uncharacterized protein n=1 Tax=Petrolisthes cinctipes TaxID=88211 RepID=A0AAE1BSZ1_PETCI|nr:hypothetical protein Pcinc_037356 [Petrolisthes cinctipes]